MLNAKLGRIQESVCALLFQVRRVATVLHLAPLQIIGLVAGDNVREDH